MFIINDYKRPNPEYLLTQIEKEEEEACSTRGKLKIFFGYAAGVGKTYAMLMEAHDMKALGKDIVIGYIEPHARKETIALINGIENIGPKIIEYRGIEIKEFDLDTALKRKPDIILVDELAHTNARGKRHRKRWQDIEELLDAGINVYTTLNVQHIESLNDAVESITNVFVRETVPDKIFDEAEKVELIDIEPDELLNRFSDGKIYSKEQTKRAFKNFFVKSNLFALREIALRRTADRVKYEVENVRLAKGQITVMPTSDKILACISKSPSSGRIIRTAARMSEAHHCKWIALYVEETNAQNLSEEDKKVLNENFNLAEELGGEIVTLYSDNIVEQIIDYAKFRNITKIIIGKDRNRIKKISRLYSKDIAEKLMECSDCIDIYVIPNLFYTKKENKFNIKPPIEYYIRIKELLKSVLIMGITTAITLLFWKLGGSEANIIMFFILGVIVTYIVTTGHAIGIISSVVSVFLFNYFFTEPRYSFKFYDKNYLFTFIIMLIVAFIIGMLTNKIQKEAKNSVAREKRTQILYRVSKKLLSAKGTTDLVAIGIKYISRLTSRTVICYLANGEALAAPFIYNEKEKEKNNELLTRNEEAVAYWTFLNGKESGTGTSTFYGSKGYYMPIKGNKKILGVIGVSCEEGILEPEQKFIFETVTSEIAIALEREIFFRKQEESTIEIERERLRSNLLRSISHDLRSPLSGIKGSISTILENGDLITEAMKKNLLESVYDDTEWLIRLVENLLSMTKVDEGKMQVKKQPEVVEEVVYEAVQRSEKYFNKNKISVNVPEDILIANMDGSLIEQVLINLIDNATKFSPKDEEININIYDKGKKVVFEVEDNGIGIKEEIRPYIFNRFFTDGGKVSDSRRGVGLGLVICKSIIEAHGGEIEAINKKQGGTIFRFNIPK